MNRKLSNEEMEMLFKQALRGMARLQARQEMMECVLRALIVESPPAHALFWKALNTAKQDWERRSAQARDLNPPEIDADAMALWNVLMQSCEPPATSST
jgi:hypothetical protein